MADLILERPQAGQHAEYAELADAQFVLGFSSADAVLERQDDSLVFTFDDGASITLPDFYNAFTRDTLPEFTIDGQKVAGEDFFAALGDETLMPAAGPAAQQAADGNRYRDYTDMGLLSGLDRLDGLDLGLVTGQNPEGNLDAYGGGGTGTDPFNLYVNAEPGVNSFAHSVYEDGIGFGLPQSAGGWALTGSVQGDGAHTFTWTGNLTGTYGTFVANADGNYTYTLNNGDELVQELRQNETRTETFTYSYRDADGDVATGEVVITIVGRNDDIQLTGNASKTLKEDGVGSIQQGNNQTTIVDPNEDNTGKVVKRVSGDFTVTDKDLNDTQTMSIAIDGGVPSSLGVMADGQSVTQALLDAQGRTLGVLTLTKTVIDGHSATYSYSFALDAATDWMNYNEVFTPQVTFIATDGYSTGQYDLSLKIFGTNDKPELTIDQGTWTLTDNNSNQIYQDGGFDSTFTVTDPDMDGQSVNGDYANHKFSVSHNGSTPTQSAGYGQGVVVEGKYGTLTLNADGTYTYALKPGTGGGHLVDGLGNGESFTETFNVKVADRHSAWDQGSIVISITGTDDLPIISGTSSSLVVKEAGVGTGLDAQGNETVLAANTGYGGKTSSSSTFTVNDTDVTDTQTFQLTDGSGNVLLSGNAPGTHSYVTKGMHNGVEIELGRVTVTASGRDSAGNVTYTVKYDMYTTTQIDALGPDDDYHFDYKVTVTSGANNGSGSSVEHNVDIDVYGTNDKPVARYTTHTVKEDGVYNDVDTTAAAGNPGSGEHRFAVSGTLQTAVSDAEDAKAELTFSIGTTAKLGNQTVTLAPVNGEPGAYTIAGVGKLVFNADGTYTFTLFPDASQINTLGEGESLKLTFDYTVTDTHGASAGNKLNIDIKGTNDRPELAVGYTSGQDVVEDGTPQTVTGTVTPSDVDANNAGTFTYEIRPEGSNDPVQSLSHNAAGNGQLVIQGTYGYLTLKDDGSFEYTLNNFSNEVQALAKGEQVHEVFDVNVLDKHGDHAKVPQKIDITITGQNDSPLFVATIVNAFAVVEEGYNHLGNAVGSTGVTGTIDATDLDNNAVLTYSITGKDGTHDLSVESVWGGANSFSLATEYGTLLVTRTADATGGWSYNYEYTLDNSNATVNGLRPGETGKDTFTLQVTDEHGASSNQQVTVTIVGTNDKPEVSGQTNLTFTDGQAQNVLTGQLAASDVDAPDAHGIPSGGTYSDYRFSLTGGSGNALTTIAGTYGYLELDGMTGEYKYHLYTDAATQKAIKELGQGATLNDIFKVQVVDDLGLLSEVKDLTVTIAGKNDGFTLTGNTQTIMEDQAISNAGTGTTYGGTLTVTDVDGDTLLGYTAENSSDVSGAIVLTGTYGTLTINQDGSYSYVVNTLSDTHKAYLDSLNNGRGVQETFNFGVQQQLPDGSVANKPGSIVINITGENDNPVFTQSVFIAGDASSTVYLLHAKVTATDIDNAYVDGSSAIKAPESVTLKPSARPLEDTELEFYFKDAGGKEVTSINGTYGTFMIDPATGGYTYILSPYAAAYTGRGNNPEEKVTVYVKDADGGLHQSEIVVNLPAHGTDPGDVPGEPRPPAPGTPGTGVTPEKLDPEAITVKEDAFDDPTHDKQAGDGIITGAGQLSGQHPPYYFAGGMQALINEYGTIYIDPQTGKYVFILNNSSDKVQQLGEGVDLPDFTIPVENAAGWVGDITITIKGTNDIPTVDNVSTSVVQDNSLNGVVTGTVKAHDIDLGDQATLTLSLKDGNGNNVTSLQGKYGVITLVKNANGEGEYKYTLNTGEDLSADFKYSENFNFVAYNDKEYSAAGTINVNVTGTNNGPVLTATSETVTEDASIRVTIATVLDDTDGMSVGITSDNNGSTGPSYVKGAYGSLIFNAATGTFEYVLDNESAAVQSLKQGETKTEAFTIVVTDKHGATISEKVTVEVTGTNDAPQLYMVDSAGQPLASLVITEGAVRLSDVSEVTLVAHDKDAGDTATFSIFMNGSWQGISDGFSCTFEYGTLTFLGGKLSFVANAAATKLTAGEVATYTPTIKVTDSAGATSEQTLEINVVGTNGAPSVTTGLSTVTAGAMGVAVSVSDSISATDPEGGALSFFFDGGTNRAVGAYGTLIMNADGTYTYTLNNDSPEVRQLSVNDQRNESFIVHVQDAHGAVTQSTVEITVNGSNDAPILTVGENKTLTDDGTANQSVSGAITATDIDGSNPGGTKDTLTFSIVGDHVGTMGTLVLNADGTYTYTVNADKYDLLAKFSKNDSLQETFTVQVSDGHGGITEQTLTVTVQGKNEAPTATVTPADPQASLTEGDGTTVTGTIGIADQDGGWSEGGVSGVKDSLSLNVNNTKITAPQTINGIYGTLAIALEAEGTYSYTYTLVPAWAEKLAEGEVKNDIFTVKANDGTADSAASSITIPVTGTNSTPVITIPAGSDTDIVVPLPTDPASALQINGTVAITDPDTGDVSYVTIAGDDSASGSTGTLTVQGLYGTLEYNVAMGTYVYTLNAEHNDVKYLDKSATLKDEFNFSVNDRVDGSGLTANNVLEIEIKSDHSVQQLAVSGTLTGSNDADKLFGSGFDDALYGGAGDDILFGGNGNDYLNGGAGVNQLYGGDGNDILVFSQQNSVMDGGTGIDFLIGVSDMGSLDTLLGASAVTDVEVIVMGNTSLTSMNDLAGMGISINGSGQLELGNGWIHSQFESDVLPQNVSSIYDAYTNGDEMILIQKQLELGQGG